MCLFQWLKNTCDQDRRPIVHIPDGPKTPSVRMRYCFSGYVQGVGFRYEAKMLADKLNLTGWVRNESDGTVVAEIEGPVSYINEFLRVMQAIPRFDITDIQAECLPLCGTETSFKALYY